MRCLVSILTHEKRRNYFGKSATEASIKAAQSFGISEDLSLFSFYSNVYLPTVKHRSERWLEQIGWAMDTHVLPEFGERDIRELKRPELQMFFNKLGRKLKSSSSAKVKIVLSGILRLAMADEIIPVNPLTFVRLPAPDRVEKTSLSLHELRSLIEASGPLIKPFVILAGCAGLRLGEAVGLTRGAISREGVLSIRQQVQQFKGRCDVSPKLKTDQSRRDIPLPKAMLEALLGCGQVSDIWICSDSKGGYVRPKNIPRELRIACTKAEIPMVSPHELRHTFISLMDNEIEAPRTVVMALAGHAAQSTTDGYSHVKIEQKIRWMERLWDQVSTACSPEEWATRTQNTGSIELKELLGTPKCTRLELFSRFTAAESVRHGPDGNAAGNLGVKLSVMRRHRTWINMVAMLALFLGAIPGSVFASLLSDPKCEMPCCLGKPAHQPDDKVCAKGCDTKMGHPSEPVAQIKEKEGGCACSIGSAPPPSQPAIAATSSTGFGSPDVHAILPLEPRLPLIRGVILVSPGILGSDSGPPASGPDYVSLGRAPPVFLA